MFLLETFVELLPFVHLLWFHPIVVLFHELVHCWRKFERAGEDVTGIRSRHRKKVGIQLLVIFPVIVSFSERELEFVVVCILERFAHPVHPVVVVIRSETFQVLDELGLGFIDWLLRVLRELCPFFFKS